MATGSAARGAPMVVDEIRAAGAIRALGGIGAAGAIRALGGIRAARAASTLLLALALVPVAAAGQSLCAPGVDAGVAPAFLQDGESRRTLGLGLSIEGCRQEHDVREAFSRSTYIGGRLVGLVPLSSAPRIPQNLEAAVQGGISMSLARRRPIDLDDDPDAELYDFDYGFAAAGARLQYESSADFREQAVAGGMELRWVDPRRPLLPSVVATVEAVQPARSRVRDLRGMGRDPFGRLGVRGYWLVPLPARFHLELDASAFRSFGLDEPGDVEEPAEPPLPRSGRFAEATLGYGLGRPVGPLRIESVFVGHARGRLPTGAEGRRAWTIGATLELAR